MVPSTSGPAQSLPWHRILGRFRHEPFGEKTCADAARRTEKGPRRVSCACLPLANAEAAHRGPLLGGNANEPRHAGQCWAPAGADRPAQSGHDPGTGFPTGCGKPCGRSVEDRRCAVDHTAGARHNGRVTPPADDTGRLRGRPGRGAAPDRVPARAQPGRDLQGQGVPVRRGDDPARWATRSPSGCGPGPCASCPASAPRPPRSSRPPSTAGCPTGWPGSSARSAGRWSQGGEEVRVRAARRPALAQRLVRRRLADRGDGLHRDRARPRLPRAHRPLAAAEGRQRAVGRPADPAARGGRGGQRAPRRPGDGGFRLLKGIEVDILDDGSLDQTDEMLARLDVRVASVHSKLADGQGAR